MANDPIHTPPPVSVQYPKPDFNIRVMGGRQMIRDDVRKKFVSLTPEEWVRQNFISYLVKTMHYPAPLMAVEKEIRLGELKKRCDIVVYKNSIPWMIVECKEPGTIISEKTLRQILGYNITLQVPYLILTNGDYTCGIHRGRDQWNFITALPGY